MITALQKDYYGILGILTKRAIIWGAPLACNDNIEIQMNLIQTFEQIIKRKIIFTQFRFFNPLNANLRKYFLDNKYYYEPYLNIIVDTSIGVENIWKNIEEKQKRRNY